MKLPKAYLKRKKQSQWHWNFNDISQDSKMYKIVANIQGKWPKVPKATGKNKFLYSNPIALQQQEHWGVKNTDNYVGMNLDKKNTNRYAPFIKATGLKDPVAYVHTQNPGQMTIMHMDNARADNKHTDKNGKPLTESQRRERIARLFIMLDDWHPGQVMLMGSQHFYHWKKGDVMYFSWQHLPHGTANFGHQSRPMLFVQGEVTPKFTKLLNSKQKQTIKI